MIKNDLKQKLDEFNFSNKEITYSFILSVCNTNDKMQRLYDFVNSKSYINRNDIILYTFKIGNIPIYPGNKMIENAVSEYELRTCENDFVEN